MSGILTIWIMVFLSVKAYNYDACNSHPCLNGGLCLPSTTSYNCFCDVDYFGTNCENVSPCRSNPCLNGGTCRRFGSNYFCTCAQGYVGTTCSWRDRCMSNPCRNGGTCSSAGPFFSCSCASGYSGTFCDKNSSSSACLFKPCANGGACIPLGNSYTCFCKKEYTGTNCTSRLLEESSPVRYGVPIGVVGVFFPLFIIVAVVRRKGCKRVPSTSCSDVRNRSASSEVNSSAPRRSQCYQNTRINQNSSDIFILTSPIVPTAPIHENLQYNSPNTELYSEGTIDHFHNLPISPPPYSADAPPPYSRNDTPKSN